MGKRAADLSIEIYRSPRRATRVTIMGTNGPTRSMIVCDTLSGLDEGVVWQLLVAVKRELEQMVL